MTEQPKEVQMWKSAAYGLEPMAVGPHASEATTVDKLFRENSRLLARADVEDRECYVLPEYSFNYDTTNEAGMPTRLYCDAGVFKPVSFAEKTEPFGEPEEPFVFMYVNEGVSEPTNKYALRLSLKTGDIYNLGVDSRLEELPTARVTAMLKAAVLKAEWTAEYIRDNHQLEVRKHRREVASWSAALLVLSGLAGTGIEYYSHHEQGIARAEQARTTFDKSAYTLSGGQLSISDGTPVGLSKPAFNAIPKYHSHDSLKQARRVNITYGGCKTFDVSPTDTTQLEIAYDKDDHTLPEPIRAAKNNVGRLVLCSIKERAVHSKPSTFGIAVQLR